MKKTHILTLKVIENPNSNKNHLDITLMAQEGSVVNHF